MLPFVEADFLALQITEPQLRGLFSGQMTPGIYMKMLFFFRRHVSGVHVFLPNPSCLTFDLRICDARPRKHDLHSRLHGFSHHIALTGSAAFQLALSLLGVIYRQPPHFEEACPYGR